MPGCSMLQSLMSIVLTISILFVFAPRTSHADNAEVLPKSVSRVSLNAKLYFEVDHKYDNDGNKVDPAYKFNANLNSNVFPDLAILERAFGLPPGSASLGTSEVSFRYDFDLFEFSYQYGLTDRLSLGVMIPYWFVHNHVDARLNTTNATIGKNPRVPGGLAPLSVPGTVPLTTNDVKNLLSSQFGYRRFETWDQSGFADIEAGFKYQYLNTDNWKLAFAGGLRFPTGREDDPDNLVDYPFGQGVYAILFRSNNDYTGIKNLVLDLTLRYDWLLPDKDLQRVPQDVDHPITNNKEKVDRNRGDIIEIEGSASYEFIQGFTFSLLYKYGYGFQDQIHGDKGYAYDSLQSQTNYEEQVYIVGLSYSTIPLFREKKFPVPMTATLSYRDRFAGKNTLESQYIGVTLAVFF